MGPRSKSFRYHLILGDGHRSQFNLALQVGATALALRVVEEVPDLEQRLERAGSIRGKSSWVETLNGFNVLAQPGEVPRVDPRVIAVQRVYLDAAKEWHADQKEAPGWVARLLGDWEATLAALESMDLPWLSARLDTFIKYELFSAVLRESGRSWRDLPGATQAQSELALIDHAYHAFCDPDSPFARLDRRGLLAQRVGEPIVPGSEAEPFVPDTQTRARARGRFIRQHAKSDHMIMDWAAAYDATDGRRWDLSDPFAEEYTAPERKAPRQKGDVAEQMFQSSFNWRMRLARRRARSSEGPPASE